MKIKQIYFYDGTPFLVVENKDGELIILRNNGLTLLHRMGFMHLSILMEKMDRNII